MDEARDRLAAALGVESDELSFSPSTTQNTCILARAFAEHLSPGDAIVVTDQATRPTPAPGAASQPPVSKCANGVSTPAACSTRLAWRLLGDRVSGCTSRTAQRRRRPQRCSRAVRIAHCRRGRNLVDGVSYAPHGLPNVGKLGADIYLFSSYKTFGPHQGIMVVRRALADALPSQAHYFNAGYRTKKFTPAGPDHAQIAACAGMVDYLETLHDHHFPAAAGTASLTAKAEAVHDLSRDYENALLQPLLDFLGTRNSIRPIGPRTAADKAPTVAVHSQRTGEDLATALAPRGIMAGGGDFYGVRCLKALASTRSTAYCG